MYVLRKIKGDLNKVACDVQCHWDGEHYVEYSKDILNKSQAYIEIDGRYRYSTDNNILYL